MKTLFYILGFVFAVIIILIIIALITKRNLLMQPVNSAGQPTTANGVPIPSSATILNEVDLMLLSGLPFVDEPKVLSGVVPMKYTNTIVDFSPSRKYMINVGSGNPLNARIGRSINTGGGNASGLTTTGLAVYKAVAGFIGLSTEIATSSHDVSEVFNSVKIKDMFFSFTGIKIIVEFNPTIITTYRELVATHYKTADNKVFPLPANAKVYLAMKNSAITNDGNFKGVDRDLMQTLVNTATMPTT